MKKLVSLILAVMIFASLGTTAFADYNTNDISWNLNISGTGDVFDYLSDAGMVNRKAEPTRRASRSTLLSCCDVIETTNAPGSTSDVSFGDWEDTNGNIWLDAVKLWVVDREGWANKEHVVFDLGGDYDEFCGIIACGKDSDRGAKMYIKVYLDGKLAFTSADVKRSSEPNEFRLDVRGCEEMKIECVTHSSSFGYTIVTGVLSR